ncbi:[protein-PII] uridylyltransferase [Nakamurella flavida]|uniref:Bifunctional uridylyltransferase/uridylyl-removing enzyme n=1 Tax=Nakamurella flavida TaxID=363630 RepID=A0A939BZX5_9ACTN|nr:[protein-PII] uridylyltransferase [Nakamurella flavida]MBM9476128.1 [protein-PII] uridylyltransferase [Nakamurella flavida]MDP9777127.1 [protein-PII] uridylyltransferase [Nakamurella flavida]
MPNSSVPNSLGTVGGFRELRTQLLSRAGLSGPARRRALARLTDGWLIELADEAGVNVGGVALVAVGGFGRGELSPFSDLDLVLLHSTETPASYAGMLAERLWYPIWDSRIRLDHSVRSVGGARQVARTDLPAMLGMLDLRHIAGDPELATTLHRRVLADWRADARDRLPDLRESARERERRSGELAFATTPDLKESRGGMRDLVVMRAVAASWVADCPHQGLEEARSALLDVRDAAQTVAARATDRLQPQDQQAVAAALGLDDADMLLRHVAAIGRTVDHATELTWHRVGRALSRPTGQVTDLGGRFARKVDRTPLADGVVEQEGEAMLARGVNPAVDPTLTLRAAAAAAQAGLPVSPATVQRLAKTSPPLPTPWPAPALQAFLRLIGAGESMLAVWEDLDQAGLISTLLPGWERLRSLPQRDPVHLYTVDRHLMQTSANAAGLIRRVSRPDLLLLAAIFHDIGKGTGRDHSVAGAEMIGPWLDRMGCRPADRDRIALLVRHHLLLSETATKRDPDDPATVAVITAAIGDPDTLDLLHALTEADATAAGPAAWTTWKASQVAYLVGRAKAALAGASAEGTLTVADQAMTDALGEPGVAAGEVTVRIVPRPGALDVVVTAPDRPGLLATAAGVLTLHRLSVSSASARTVDGTAVQTWTVVPEFGDVPESAALRTDLRLALDGTLDVAARLARRTAAPRRPGAAAAPPSVRVLPGASDQATVLEVRARDVPGLLMTVATGLAAQGVTVDSAWVNTLGADAVDVFYLHDSTGVPLAASRAVEVAESVRIALD